MPGIPMPPPGMSPPSFFSGRSAISASVVRIIVPILAAFCTAVLVTLAGSIIPAESIDLSRIENIANLPSADLCLMFKVVDVLESEKKGHKYSEEVIKLLAEKCGFVVFSFATRTVSGRSMNFPQRGWIERMLTRIGLKYKMLEFESEIFYVISKKN